MGGTGSNFNKVNKEFVEGILQKAETTHLVTRPFRYEDNKTRIQGMCFCCDDCCYYFTESQKRAIRVYTLNKLIWILVNSVVHVEMSAILGPAK